MDITRRRFSVGIAAASAAAALAGAPSTARAGELGATVDAIRLRRGLPALAVLAGRHGALLQQAATGVRARGNDVAVSTQDRWHIGSCAKSMTATLIARYVERGALAWDAPLTDLLPERAAGMHAIAGRITLYQLLTMTSGLPENPTLGGRSGDLVARLRAIESLAGDDQARRRLVAEHTLATAPPGAPGARFGYSNTNYIILGAIAERVGEASFERLIAREVFQPLQMQNVGFGAPGSDAALDQPRGHEARRNGSPIAPQSPLADLPSYMRPAGGIHLSLNDWARFVFDHVGGENGQGVLLKRETYERLHTPAPGSDQPYACGWGAPTRAGRKVLTHVGNNTLWTAGVHAYPASGYIFLYAANDGRESSATAAFKNVEEDLAAQYRDI
ncbi:MAG: serine hydrolase [Hyphomonadaceae bacterium]|nr:serine hydrolase [Hyphomonadaceae bacterium]